jgi:hypothetical protein
MTMRGFLSTTTLKGHWVALSFLGSRSITATSSTEGSSMRLATSCGHQISS